jgi:hypothetical protein
LVFPISCLFPLVLLLLKTCILFAFFIWAYFMKVIPKTCRAHWTRYICIYWKHTVWRIFLIVYLYGTNYVYDIQYCGMFPINTYISSSVGATRFWNNLHKVRPNKKVRIFQKRVAPTELYIYIYLLETYHNIGCRTHNLFHTN